MDNGDVSFFFITTLDLDECGENFNRCEQTCMNDPGSYHCGCNTGYILNQDGYGCDGRSSRWRLHHGKVLWVHMLTVRNLTTEVHICG